MGARDALHQELAQIDAQIDALREKRRTVKARLASIADADALRAMDERLPDHGRKWLEPLVRRGESLQAWCDRMARAGDWDWVLPETAPLSERMEQLRDTYESWSGFDHRPIYPHLYLRRAFKAADPRVAGTEMYAIWYRQVYGADPP